MKLYLPFFICALILVSCQQKPAEVKTDEPSTGGTVTEPLVLSADLQNYENEIMKIHDEVMPRMSEINQLATKLKSIKAAAGTTEAGKPNTPDGLDDALNALRAAEQYMMDWMKEYSDGRATFSEAEMPKFLEKELSKVTEVKIRMLNAIDKANSWIAAHPS
ncbi:MAG: hypothetical protein ABIQ11_06685 [Saprospiraceae bacterium]